MNFNLIQRHGDFAKTVKLATAIAALIAATAAHAVSIVSVSSGPQDGGNQDIKFLTDPVCCGAPHHELGLHDHHYVSPHVPDPSHGYVIFKFDVPVIVRGMAVIQHTNGLTLIEHLAGASRSSLVSEGTSWGNRGDVTGSGVFTEFERDQFSFSGTEAGRVHKFIIHKTSLHDGYASYRWYLDFAAPVPEPATWATLSAGVLALLWLGQRRRTAASEVR